VVGQIQRPDPQFGAGDPLTEGFILPTGYSDDLIRITDMTDALEILRSNDFIMEPSGKEAPLRDGTLLKLDGDLHRTRRRVVNPLVRRESHQKYRNEILLPAVERRMAALLKAPDDDGFVRTDLVAFSRRLFLELAAAFVGIQGLDTQESVETLGQLIEPMHTGSVVKWFPNQDAVMVRALAALDVFRGRFFEPSLAARKSVVAAVGDEATSSERLPSDLVTLIALSADPAWTDEALALRTVVFYLAGASHTHVRPLGHIVDELEKWFAIHPEDYPSRTDPEFLSGAISEALRLYGNTPALFRVATAEVHLPSGLQVNAGECVAIDTRLTGQDPSVYGPDAHHFNPRRRVEPGTYAFGMAFGSSEHMCQGLPLVLGTSGIDGNLMHVLRALYGAGMRRDRSRATVKIPVRDSYEVYPVMFDVAAMNARVSTTPIKPSALSGS
jgi:cytochrome P450